MGLTWAPLHEPEAEQIWQKLLRPMAAELRGSAGELSERAVARMQAEMPALFADPQSVKENQVSCEASIRLLADIIEVAGDPHDVELPASTVAIARAGVQRQIPLANFMRFYRLAQDLVWQWMWDRVTASAADQTQQALALRLATGWLFDYIDAALNRAEQAYEAEREVWLRNTAAARTAAIDDIVAERERDPQRASKRLRYEINRHHIGAVAWVDSVPKDRDPQSSLSEALTILAREMGSETTLIHPASSLAALGWFSRQNPFKERGLDTASPGRIRRRCRMAFGSVSVSPGVA